MRTIRCLFLSLCTMWSMMVNAQDNTDRSWNLSFMLGVVNYQGDLQPNSFSLTRAGSLSKIGVRKSFSNRISAGLGLALGKISADDKYNRDYLQRRNLSFQTVLKEASLDLNVALFDLYHTRFTPYIYGSAIVFHYNPYVLDTDGEKVFLQPLSTEGQGLQEYPYRKPYQLLQFAVGFGGGIRYLASDNLIIKVEATQRKTFTDYLDDVSKTYVDQDRLGQAKGPKSVEYAFRGDELNNGQIYPPDGEQRGTPKEMDWYYYMGIGIEFNFDTFSGLFTGKKRNKDYYNSRCPTKF
ncbi:MAG TPA: DUF6089 family protein [Flavisolibacter sp.]|nr:DUF6089 family protein [Flavisolibacter sp.]